MKIELTEKIYEVAKMNSKGKLVCFVLINAETWEKARNIYKRKFGGQDYQIFVREI